MQKFTIFSVLFAIVVVSVSAELLFTDYVRELYPAPQTNVLNTLDDLDQVNEQPEEQAETTDPENQPDPIDTSDLQELAEQADPLDNLPSAPGSEAIEQLVGSLLIDNISYEPRNYDGQVFSVLDTDSINPDTVAFGVFLQGNTQIGGAYEFQFETLQSARQLYIDLRNQAQDLEFVDVNETNQFGDASFYINHSSKINEVFVVTVSGSRLYAFVYTREVHENFKPFFGLLL